MGAAILLYVYAAFRVIGWFTGSVSGGLISVSFSVLITLALGYAFQNAASESTRDNGMQASLMAFAWGIMMVIGTLFGSSNGGWGLCLVSILLVFGVGAIIRIKRKFGAVLCLVFALTMFCQFFD